MDNHSSGWRKPEDMLPGVFVHIVTFNSAGFIDKCLSALLSQNGFEAGKNLTLEVTDNASADDTVANIKLEFGDLVKCVQNRNNLGFCAAQNQGVRRFLDSGREFMLVLNPDLRLEADALAQLVSALAASSRAGCAGPRLIRADDRLEPAVPRRLDAAGMTLRLSLRHFDRGSEEEDRGQFMRQEFVFGISGACLLMKRSFVQSLLLRSSFESDLGRVHPELLQGLEERALLFDEGFFAFREDADLAWRARHLRWKCLYVPSALGYHRRTVLPGRRAALPDRLNLLGVRNRFLMQINNYRFLKFPAAFVPGIIVRNILVILGVLMIENKSLPAFSQVLRLSRRALARRKLIQANARRREMHGY